MTNIIQDYDLSALTAPPVVKENPQKKNKALMDKAITEMVLADHPEHFKQVLSDVGLASYWKALLEDTFSYSVIQPLAINRALNFYEGGTRLGFSNKELRNGVLICIMSATVSLKKPEWFACQGITGPIQCYSPIKGPDLLLTHLSRLDEADIQYVRTTLKELSKSDFSRFKSTKETVTRVLVDSFKMWTMAKDRVIHRLMGIEEERYKHLSSLATREIYIPAQFLKTGYEVYSRSDISLFLTPWGKAKSVKFNVIQKFNQIVKKESYAY